MTNKISLQSYIKKQMKNPEFKKEYEKLQKKYEAYYSIGINAKTISKLLSEINAENQK